MKLNNEKRTLMNAYTNPLCGIKKKKKKKKERKEEFEKIQLTKKPHREKTNFKVYQMKHRKVVQNTFANDYLLKKIISRN